MNRQLISVVVLGYNNFEKTTKPCLESLRPWVNDKDIEILVFDNSSSDGSKQKTEQWCQSQSGFNFHASDKNLGYAGGMNKASELTSGQWLLLVNNDTEFPTYTLDALKKAIRNAPSNTAMLGPITNAAGNGQRLYDPTKSKSEWLELGAWLNSHSTGMYIPTYRSDFFCIAIRRDAWSKLNGLDTIFGRGYYEDFDFSLRLTAAGYEQAITEDVFVYHQGSATFSSTPEQRILIKKNKQIMQLRHPSLKFQHARRNNLEVLLHYGESTKHDQNIHHLTVRKKIRMRAIQLDKPKSAFKKIYWNWILKRSKIQSA